MLNIGMLLNAAVCLLRHSDYDYFVFHGSNILPTDAGAIPYDFPYGKGRSKLARVAEIFLPTHKSRMRGCVNDGHKIFHVAAQLKICCDASSLCRE